MKLPSYSVLVGALLGACSSAGTLAGVANDDFSSLNGSTVEVVAEGGIAALSLRQKVEHDSKKYVSVQRHICTTDCRAPIDSVAGTLAASTTDSLFTIVLEAHPFALRDDYGTTANGADMPVYTVRITNGGNVKSIRADEGTMPAPLRRIVDAVRGTIAAAR